MKRLVTVIFLAFCLVFPNWAEDLNVFQFNQSMFSFLRAGEIKYLGEKDPIFSLWQRAVAGDATSQHQLSERFFIGSDTYRDVDESFKWNMLAAIQGHCVAQRQVGVALEMGYGTAKNSDQALFWYYQAANHGDLPAEDYFLQLLKRLASESFIYQFTLGAYSMGCTRDNIKFDESATLLKKTSTQLETLKDLAQSGNDIVAYGLFCVYLYGFGPKANSDIAVDTDEFDHSFRKNPTTHRSEATQVELF